MLRTHEAGTLRAAHTGQTVTLTGWVARRRDHGGVAFLDVRDASGVVQVVARDEVLTGAAQELRNEYVVKVVGPVRMASEVTPEHHLELLPPESRTETTVKSRSWQAEILRLRRQVNLASHGTCR